jgi:hypothetical protein
MNWNSTYWVKDGVIYARSCHRVPFTARTALGSIHPDAPFDRRDEAAISRAVLLAVDEVEDDIEHQAAMRDMEQST